MKVPDLSYKNLEKYLPVFLIGISFILGLVAFILYFTNKTKESYRKRCRDKDNLQRRFRHKLAADTAVKICDKYGPPNDTTSNSAVWRRKGDFDTIVVQDEKIPHQWPIEHIDFVYSTRKFNSKDGKCSICLKDVCTIAKATGSIMVDQLKCEATARCHYLIKNDVSLNFVQMVADGKIKPADARHTYAHDHE